MNSTQGFIGFDKFVWFQGVVEDRNDPLQLGRLRVRILGLHTKDKTQIPTDSLPWAYVISPITSAAMGGIGITPLGPVEGTWVVGFFRDGENCQEPIVFGSLGGIPNEVASKQIGFNDPNGKYPTSDRINEPDTNRLARGKIDNTIVSEKNKNLTTNIDIALDKDITTWNEPSPEFNSKYPHNHVYESESGHVFEVDDTKDNERISQYHRKGTYYQILSDGTKVTKVVNDNYSLTIGGDYVYIEGVCNVTVGGDCNLLVKGDANVEINNDTNIAFGGDVSVQIGGKLDVFSADNVTIAAGGNMDMWGGNRVKLDSDKSINLSADDDITASAGDDISFGSSGTALLRGNNKTEVSSGKNVAILADKSVEVSGKNGASLSSPKTVEIDGDMGANMKSKSIVKASAPVVTRGGKPFWN